VFLRENLVDSREFSKQKGSDGGIGTDDQYDVRRVLHQRPEPRFAALLRPGDSTGCNHSLSSQRGIDLPYLTF
jgi:hypothetical protein